MSNTELLPCPFCNWPAQKESGFLPLESVEYVFCSNLACDLHSHEVGFVESTWNTRAPIKAAADQEPDSVIKESLNTEPVAWLQRKKGDIEFIRGVYTTERTADELEFAMLDGDEILPLYLYLTPPANKDSERLAFVLGHGTPGSWNYPSGKKYGYARGNRVFESAIEAIDAAISASKIRD